MDFLDPKKRKAHKTRLFIGYGLIAIAIGIMTWLLVLAVTGKSYDPKTGTIVENGLLFVSSHPTTASISINGKDKGETNNRFVLEAGNYKVVLSHKGYRDWIHDVNLEGASVERLVYPFLFPTTLVSTDVQLYADVPDMVTQSPDRHWIVTHRAATLTNLDVTDANSKDSTTTQISLPASLLTAHDGAHSLSAVEWSTDNRHLLVNHVYVGGSEYIMVDREKPDLSVNINKLLNHSYTTLALRDKKSDQLYGYDANGGVLQLIDLNRKTATTTLDMVSSFFAYGSDTLLYVTTAGAPANKALIKIRQGVTDYTLRTVTLSPTYFMNMASFNGDDYVVVGDSADSAAYIYLNPLAALKKVPPQLPPAKALLKVDNAEFVSFSQNARFVALQGQGKFAVYDLEYNRQLRYDTGIPAPAGQKAPWMDGHRLSLVDSGKLTIFDFDGTNKQSLIAIAPAQTPYFDRDYTALYTVSPSSTVPSRMALVRSELIVK